MAENALADGRMDGRPRLRRMEGGGYKVNEGLNLLRGNCALPTGDPPPRFPTPGKGDTFTIRPGGHFYNGPAYHGLKLYCRHPDGDPATMNPVDAADWLTAKAVLDASPPDVYETISIWCTDRLGLDEAVHVSAYRCGCGKDAVFNDIRKACRLYAIRRGLLWEELDTATRGGTA